MKAKQNAPALAINDAAQMRDVFKVLLTDAITENDETGQIIYGACVNYWTLKARINQFNPESLTL
jgi:hypothetical protein